MRALLEKVYSREGYVVRAASTVSEAEAMFDAEVWLLVLDYSLPDGTASDLLRTLLRGGEVLPPTFLLSADLDAVDELELSCFDAVRAKPCSIGDLRGIARHLMHERHRRRSGVRLSVDAQTSLLEADGEADESQG